MGRIRRYFIELIEQHKLIRRIAMAVALVFTCVFGWIAAWILLARPDGSVTLHEVALIGIFCSTGAGASYLYHKTRDGE